MLHFFGENPVPRLVSVSMVAAWLILLSIAGCGGAGGSAQTAPPPPEVSVAQVLQKRVKDWDEFTGRLQAVQTVEIRPRVSGYIDLVAFTEGKVVNGGNNGGTFLTSVVSLDPIYLYFEGDEATYLRYIQLARAGERPSSRDAPNPVHVGLANEEGFPHEGKMDFVDNQVNSQ